MSLWKSLVGRFGSGANDYDDVRIDASTNSLQTVDYEHHEIHSGNHYNICSYETFTNKEVVDFTIITPDTTEWTHMTFNISGTGALSLEIHEDVTVSATGTAAIVFNNNRNSANTTNLTIRTGDTFSDDGDTIYLDYSGANKVIGILERSREIILKQGTAYLFRISNQLTTDNIISYCAEWYEHTNKN